MQEAEGKRQRYSSLFRNLSSHCLSSSAFTLIEVLISLTLLTVVLGAVYSSFFSVQRALERFDNVSLKYHEARTALDIMRREIESALPAKQKSGDSKDKTVFEIKDRDIFGKNASALYLSSFSFKGNSLNRISYFVRNKNGSLDLLKTETPSIIPPEIYTIEVIEKIESFTVETLFNNMWVRTWNTANTGSLPDTVRISIEFDDNGKKIKLTEYARPKIGKKI
jgi:general secretion pathway protein J